MCKVFLVVIAVAASWRHQSRNARFDEASGRVQALAARISTETEAEA